MLERDVRGLTGATIHLSNIDNIVFFPRRQSMSQLWLPSSKWGNRMAEPGAWGCSSPPQLQVSPWLKLLWKITPAPPSRPGTRPGSVQDSTSEQKVCRLYLHLGTRLLGRTEGRAGCPGRSAQGPQPKTVSSLYWALWNWLCSQPHISERPSTLRIHPTIHVSQVKLVHSSPFRSYLRFFLTGLHGHMVYPSKYSPTPAWMDPQQGWIYTYWQAINNQLYHRSNVACGPHI